MTRKQDNQPKAGGRWELVAQEGGKAHRMATKQDAVSAYLSAIGRKGGAAGRGEAKLRKVDYAAIGRKGAEARRARKQKSGQTGQCAKNRLTELAQL